MNRFILRIVASLHPVWERMGVDTKQLVAILNVKLIMDDRRPSALRQIRGRRNNKPASRATLGTMLSSLIMGLLYLFVFALAKDDLAALTVFFFMFMVLLCLSLVSDFTYVLIDVKDNYIILPKPVTGPTVLVSRLLHIAIHLSKVVIPMVLPCFVYLCIYEGVLPGLAFLPAVLLGTMLCIFTINATYLLILKFTTVERFKDIIGLVQVVFSVFIFLLYQVVPRLQFLHTLDREMFLSRAYLYVAAPLWLAALWDALVHAQSAGVLIWCLGLLGLLVPPFCVWVMVRFLAPGFDRKLSALGSGDSGSRQKKTRGAPGTGGLYRVFSRLLTRTGPEATGFEVSWLLSGRNRDFKLRVYPSFAYVIVYFVYFALIKNGSSLTTRLAALSETHNYIIMIYFSAMALLTALANMVYTEKYKAAWVYYSSPLRAPGEVVEGALKAMIVKYFLPFYVLVGLGVYVIWGPSVIPDLVFGFCNVVLLGGLTILVSLKRLPFSAEVSLSQSGGGIIRRLMQLFIPAGIGVGHYLLRVAFPGLPLAIWIACILSGIATWLVLDKCGRLSWNEMGKV